MAEKMAAKVGSQNSNNNYVLLWSDTPISVGTTVPLASDITNFQQIIIVVNLSGYADQQYFQNIYMPIVGNVYYESVTSYTASQVVANNSHTVSFPTGLSMKFEAEYHNAWNAPVISAVYGLR